MRLPLSLKSTRELGRHPQEPYDILRRPDGAIVHEPAELRAHALTQSAATAEIQRRLAAAPSKRALL